MASGVGRGSYCPKGEGRKGGEVVGDDVVAKEGEKEDGLDGGIRGGSGRG